MVRDKSHQTLIPHFFSCCIELMLNVTSHSKLHYGPLAIVHSLVIASMALCTYAAMRHLIRTRASTLSACSCLWFEPRTHVSTSKVMLVCVCVWLCEIMYLLIHLRCLVWLISLFVVYLKMYVPPHPLIKHWVSILRNEKTPCPIFSECQRFYFFSNIL